MANPISISSPDGEAVEPRARAGVNRERILDAALALVAGGDLAALSCVSLARALRIRPPSLYKHFESLDAVRDGLAVRALTALTELSLAAISGRSGRDALEALADAQRVYAHAHPGLYEAAVRGPANPSESSVKALDAYGAVERASLRAYALSSDQAERFARCLRAAIWGFISLEPRPLARTSSEIDQSFDLMIDILDSGARSAASSAKPSGRDVTSSGVGGLSGHGEDRRAVLEPSRKF